MTGLHDRLRRLWRPDRPAFWLVVAFNLLSSVLVLIVQIADPAPGARVVLALLALANGVAGAVWLTRLWRETQADKQ